MPFSQFGLHPELLRGVREMGFTRPTPIQTDAIPPAMEGRDVLACAMTGSGKTAAFLLPILNHLIGKKRGVTRALVLTPTRELAAQIQEHAKALTVHTPLSSAAVFGGVSMGPQEHAFRTGADHPDRDAGTAARPLPLPLREAGSPRNPGPRRGRPDARHGISPRHPPRPQAPARRSARRSSSRPRCRPRSLQLTREMLKNPFTVNIERQAAPAVGITQAVYPVAQNLKAPLLIELLQRGDIRNVLVFTRTKHRANRLAETLTKKGVACERIHGNRTQAQRTLALAGFKSGKSPRPRRDRHRRPRHRRRGAFPRHQLRRAERPGGLHPPRRAHGPRGDDRRRLHVRRRRRSRPTSRRSSGRSGSAFPGSRVPGFDYAKAPAERFEVPLAERIAADPRAQGRGASSARRRRPSAGRRTSRRVAARARGLRLPAPARAKAGRTRAQARARTQDVSRAAGPAVAPATGAALAERYLPAALKTGSMPRAATAGAWGTAGTGIGSPGNGTVWPGSTGRGTLRPRA